MQNLTPTMKPILTVPKTVVRFIKLIAEKVEEFLVYL